MLWRPSPSWDRLTVAVCDDCEEYDKDVVAHVAAHARLMFRNEVPVQDAVVAVTIMESSMQVRPCILHLAWTSAVDIVPVGNLLSAARIVPVSILLSAVRSVLVSILLSAARIVPISILLSPVRLVLVSILLSAVRIVPVSILMSAARTSGLKKNTCCIKVGPTSGLPSAVVIFLTAGQTPLFKSPEVECGTSLHGGYHCTGPYDSVYSLGKRLHVLTVLSHTILGDPQGLG